MTESNFPFVVGTAVTTAILVGGIQTSAQITPIQSPIIHPVVEDLHLNGFCDRYKLLTNDNFKQENQINTIHSFASNLLENIEDLPPEFSEAVDDHFLELI